MKTRSALNFLWALALLAAISACAGCSSIPQAELNPSYQTVAEINGIPIELGELQLFFSDVKQLTRVHFTEDYGDSWNNEYDGERPVDYAINLALKNLAPYKLVQNELLKRGQMKDISFKAFVNDWENENLSRAKKKESGEVIYGPIQYSLRGYYDYLYDQQRQNLEGLMRVDPSDSDLQHIFDENSDLFYHFGVVTFQCVSLPLSDFPQESAAGYRDALAAGLDEGLTFAQAVEDAGLTDYVFERSFTEDDLRSADVRLFPDVSDALFNLEVGGITDLIENEDVEWLILYCDSRRENDRKSFEECKEELKAMFHEQHFEKQLAEMKNTAQITIYDCTSAIILQLLANGEI